MSARPMRDLCRLAVFALAAWQAWYYRHGLNPDGISYLDVADAYLRGDWSQAINGYWSPMYSWILAAAMALLQPSPDRELIVVHAVNLTLFVAAFAAFELFLTQLVRSVERRASGAERSAWMGWPPWLQLGVPYAVFAWAGLTLGSVAVVTPDTAVMAIFFLIAAVLVRLREGDTRRRWYVLLGALCGLAYLTKTFMLPLALVILGAALGLVPRRAVPSRALVAGLALLLLAGPFVTALSVRAGRFAIGDSGRLNYAWVMNRVRQIAHWQGREPRSGVPAHPTRQILEHPPAFEFATPFTTSYPPWFDASYWYQGIRLYFAPVQQLKRIVLTSITYAKLLTICAVALVALAYLNGRRWRAIHDALFYWPLLIPCIAAFVMYGLMHVEGRYISGFVAVGWLSALASVRAGPTPLAERRTRWAAAGVTVVLTAWTLVMMPHSPYFLREDLRRGGESYHRQLIVAHALQELGADAGDPVAVIGDGFYSWARLGRLRVIAEMRLSDAPDMWSRPEAMARLLRAFAGTGALAVVADPPPPGADVTGWQRVRDTGYLARRLR